jgi:hypothetical protein
LFLSQISIFVRARNGFKNFVPAFFLDPRKQNSMFLLAPMKTLLTENSSLNPLQKSFSAFRQALMPLKTVLWKAACGSKNCSESRI